MDKMLVNQMSEVGFAVGNEIFLWKKIMFATFELNRLIGLNSFPRRG